MLSQQSNAPANFGNKIVSIDFQQQELLVPPHNQEAEEAILGGIFLDPGAIARVADILKPEAFYVKANEIIYKAAIALYSQNKPTDLMLIATWLLDNSLLDQVGGQNKLAQLVQSTVSTVNIDQYALLVMDRFKRRQLIQAGSNITGLGYETATDLDFLLNEAEQAVFCVSQDQTLADIEKPAEIMLRICEKAVSPESKGMPTGIYDLDRLTGGLYPQELYVVAGRSGMGKTHFAIALTAQAVKRHEPVVFFSAEMNRDRLITRLLAWESGVNANKIKQGGSITSDEFTRLREAASTLSGIPFYLDDTPGYLLTPNRIRAAIRRATVEYGPPKLVVLDYLQLLGDESFKNNRVLELDRIVNGCKAIAKEFNCPFVALAQINRGVESRTEKRPLTSDLRESGAIEQTADGIFMLYRDEYYNPDTPDKGICEIIIGKNRDGATGTVKTLCSLETSRFNNLAQSRDDRLSYANHPPAAPAPKKAFSNPAPAAPANAFDFDEEF